MKHQNGFYERLIKRGMDFTLSLMALLVLWPVLAVLAIVGAWKMKGNPFFTQERPGKDEKIFKLIKFRSMSCQKDENGNLLPDEQRLNGYGKLLRATSLDELPELINILKGDMSIVGPRPLLVKYLPLYNETQRRRHDIRPGLTGWAQVNGRNTLTWETKFEYDVWYVDHVSFWLDVKIILMTVGKVFRRDGINSETAATMEEFKGTKVCDHV